MTKHRMLALACCIAAVGCGGSDKNAAVGKTFTYGNPTPADGSVTSGAASTLSSITSFVSNPTSIDSGFAASSAMMGASMNALGGWTGTSVELDPALGAGSRALAAVGAMGIFAPTGTFDTCTTETETSVTFTNCQWSDASGTMTLNGSASLTGGTLSWNWTLVVSMSSSGTTMQMTYRDNGSVTVTATTVKGHEESELNMTASNGGNSASLGVAQAADLDVTYADTCSTGITAGTFEAKRVWTQRPEGANASQLPDRAVKVIWTGCGSATIQLGT